MFILYPIYSVGSIVQLLETGEKGEIIAVEGSLRETESRRKTKKLMYLVRLSDGAAKKVSENEIKDVKEIKSGTDSEMDRFLADSLLLSKHKFPDNKKIDQTIIELLNIEKTGGK